jgi:zinc protease
MLPRTLSCTACCAVVLAATAGPSWGLELPYGQTRLQNGLNVIVHEDHTVPLVAVNLLYRVGAKNEQPGRTGFAHLFEHLMFMGTARAPARGFDQLIESGGGTNNAWTSTDFTDYHEVGPSTLLPTFLWLEADRLSSLGRQIDAAKLDLQRSVVLNERRQSVENRPYGAVELVLPGLLYPADHPYHHPVIGSPEDIRAAGVPDVKAFFDRYYRPSNASLAVAGNISGDQANALAERYFGWIPSGPTPPDVSPPPLRKLGHVVRETIQDRVELPKIVFAYRSPAAFAPGDAELDLLASVLSSGKSGRLYQSLVYDKGLAQSVDAEQQSSVLGSTFVVEVLARPGVMLDTLEQATDAVLRDAKTKAPSDAEVARAKGEFEFRFVDRLQSVDARASLLNNYWAETGDPGFVNKDLARYRAAGPESIRAQAERTLDFDERVIIRVVPSAANTPPPTAPAPRLPETPR